MKSNRIKILSVAIMFLAVFLMSSCSAIYGITAPENYRKGVELSSSYPLELVPIYEGSKVFSFEEKLNYFMLNLGSNDDISDIADYYSGFFADEEVYMISEVDRSNEYYAEGSTDHYDFIISAEKASGTWEERLFATTINIEINVMNIANRHDVLSYIDLAKEDLLYLSELFNDDTDIGDEDSDIEEEYENIENILTDLNNRISEIKLREVPDNENMESFSENETMLFNIAKEIVLEYEQIISYSLSLIEMGEELQAAPEFESSDLYDIYVQLNDGFRNAVNILENISPPTFLQNINSSFIDIFKQINEAVAYYLIAVDMWDPVRMDAGEYNMDILLRKMDEVSSMSDRDIADRQVKLDEDFDFINSTLDGYMLWLDTVTEEVQDDEETLSAIKDSLLIENVETAVSCSYTAPEHIIPANYRSLDNIVFLQCWTNQGTANVKITVEIPEFTQKYEQKVLLSRAEAEFSIHPPLLEGVTDSLNSSKDAQINITVENLDTGELVLQDSCKVLLYSRYDMQWYDESGTPYIENILAWVTPEASAIKELLRYSADSANYLTGGELDAIVGYQYISDWSQAYGTYVQVCSMMHAMSTYMSVKYVMAPFSSTDTNLQRLATPSEVLSTSGGLCAETAVTIASAIQATGMHPVLILLPGHMQVAVETWYNSGEYLIIETTALEAAAQEYFDSVCWYMDTDEWQYYVSQDGVTIIDCDLSEQLGIRSID